MGMHAHPACVPRMRGLALRLGLGLDGGSPACRVPPTGALGGDRRCLFGRCAQVPGPPAGAVQSLGGWVGGAAQRRAASAQQEQAAVPLTQTQRRRACVFARSHRGGAWRDGVLIALRHAFFNFAALQRR